MMLAENPIFFDRATATSGPRALHDLVRRLVLKEVLGCLVSHGIPVMPLKGALLAYWVYDASEERRVSDVDLLVPEGSFQVAIEVLSARGWRPDPPLQSRERTLRARDVPLTVDLHKTLFPKGWFRLPTKDLFARGYRDSKVFGLPVILPSPYDSCAHLVGHAAYATEPQIDPRVIVDLERLSTRFSLDARRCAIHLESTGLARAARYTLAVFGPDATFAHQVLGYLRRDPLGDLLAVAQRSLILRFARNATLAQLAVHLTNSSVNKTVEALIDAVGERLRFRKQIKSYEAKMKG